MNIILVIADATDLRVAEFAKIFAGLGHELILVSNDGTMWAKVTADGTCEPPLRAGDRPCSATVLLVHRSDLKEAIDALHAQLNRIWPKAFIFNAPGNPLPIDGFLQILKKTNRFELSREDAQEICRYAEDNTGLVPLPTCCSAENVRHHLIALDILCQGYLVARNRANLLGHELTQLPLLRPLPEGTANIVTTVDWWLKPFDGMIPRDAVARECGGAMASEIQELLDNLGGMDDGAVSRVATAHFKICDILKQ